MPFTPTSNDQGPQGPPDNQGGYGPFWGGDFTGQLNTMLAPYQKMAQQVSSPYATMSPNSWLVRNHPELAGKLDNAFLAMGMTPQAQGPEGVGGGISRAMQGLTGATQYRKQQYIQNAMLPYQMAQGQLNAMDVASQIGERSAMVPYYIGRGNMYDAEVQKWMRPSLAPGGYQLDSKGQRWQEIYNPQATGPGDKPTRLFNPATGKYADELPPEQQPDFTKQAPVKPGAFQGGGAITPSDIIGMQMSSDPTMQAMGHRAAQLYTNMQGGIAAGREAGTQEAPHPFANTQGLINEESKTKYDDINSRYLTSEEAYAKAFDPLGMKYGIDPNGTQNLQKDYANYVKPFNQMKAQRDIQFSQYRSSTAPSQGVGFQDYLQNPGDYKSNTPTTPGKQSGKPVVAQQATPQNQPAPVRGVKQSDGSFAPPYAPKPGYQWLTNPKYPGQFVLAPVKK